MALLLEKTESSYYPSFKQLFEETKCALDEAWDITSHLKPLLTHFETLEQIDFLQISKSFDLIFHLICLVWAHAKYYCRPARLIVLLQELNNLIMKRTTLFLQPIELFKSEPEESIEKIKKTYNIVIAYIKSYETHKLKVISYFKNGIPPQEWEFTPKLVFARWDQFMERMNMIRVNII